jgi:hypothetical protein
MNQVLSTSSINERLSSVYGSYLLIVMVKLDNTYEMYDQHSSKVGKKCGHNGTAKRGGKRLRTFVF